MAENISIDRGIQPVVRDVSFAIGAGEALIVTGENGAGKSTLLRALCGLLPLSGGSLRLEGFGEGENDPFVFREAINYMGPLNAMKAQLTVAENLQFWSDFAGQRGEAHYSVDEALDHVGLAHTAELPFGYLSTGMRRRVAIARLLICDRPVWAVDEPTSGLDARSSAMFSQLCRDFCADGGMLIAATHLPLGIEGAQELVIEPLGMGEILTDGAWGSGAGDSGDVDGGAGP